MNDYLVITLYEPRWHGFAKWRAEACESLASVSGVPAALVENPVMVEVASGSLRRRDNGAYRRVIMPGRTPWLSRKELHKLARSLSWRRDQEAAVLEP